MGFSARQVQALRRNLDHRHVRTREAHGRELFYVEGWYAISEPDPLSEEFIPRLTNADSSFPTSCRTCRSKNANRIKHLDGRDKPRTTPQMGRKQRHLVLGDHKRGQRQKRADVMDSGLEIV